MATGVLRDADATKKRLLAAAADEFARYGIAGARVDRIAIAAASNKAQIYHYFTSKDGLFDAVFELLVAQVLAEAPMDPADLPAYAGKLFDGYEAHPEVARLAAWYRLERGGSGGLIQAVVDANATKLTAIARAQEVGLVAAAHPPEVVLALVVHTAALWTAQTPEYDVVVAGLSADQRRAAVVAAVRALVEVAGV